MDKCPNCQQVKAEHQRARDLTQDIATPTWKWEFLSIDIVVGLPRTLKQHDFIWIIFDRMTKLAHIIPVKTTYPVEEYAKLYLKDIMRCMGFACLSS